MTPATADEMTTLENAFALAPIGLCVTQDRIVMHCNLAFSRLFSATQAQMTGQSIRIVYPSADEFEHVGRRALASVAVTAARRQTACPRYERPGQHQ